MDAPSRPQVLLAVGTALLVGGLALVSLGWPAHETEIVATAQNESALAEQSGYSAAAIDPVAVEELSAAERTAFTRARQSPSGEYTDRGASANGSAFTYRNDVVTTTAVAYRGDLYLVRTWVEINPVVTGFGAISGIGSVPLLAFGVWKARRDGSGTAS